MTIFITGKKVDLRPLSKDDLPTITTWANDPAISQYLARYRPMTYENEEAWYNSLVSDERRIVLALQTKDDSPTLFGIMELGKIDLKNQRAMTGAMIGLEKYRGGGYGTDAKMHLLHWAFTELPLKKVTSEVMATNPRSRAYLEKTGYVCIGTAKRHYFTQGDFVDAHIMEVYRDVFRKKWHEYQER